MRFRLPWGGLRLKIIVWSFVPAAIILCAVGLFSLHTYAQVITMLVLERNGELTRLQADLLSHELVRHVNALDRLAATPDIYNGEPPAQQTLLRVSLASVRDFDAGVVILDPNGYVVAADPRRADALGRNWSDRDYFRRSRPDLPLILGSDVTLDGPEGRPVVVFALPLRAASGRFTGVIAGMFGLGDIGRSAFYRSIARFRSATANTPYLVDSRGVVIYHSDPSWVGRDKAADSVVRRALDGAAGSIRTYDSGGAEIVASFAPVPDTPWTWVAEEQWSGLIEPSQHYARLLWALLLFGLLTPAAVVAVGVRRLTRPLRQLILAAQQVADGDFSPAITLRTGDEIETLAAQFSTMAARLRESYADLEVRIAARTRQLTTLNKVASVVSRSLDLETVLQAALHETLAAAGMSVGAAYLLDAEDRTLSAVAQCGFSDGAREQIARLPLVDSTAALAAVRSEPVVMPVADYPSGKLKATLEAEGLHSVISVPLFTRGRLLGAINLASTQPVTVAPDTLALLASVGRQVAMAVENALLYQRAEESAAAAERNRLARDLHDAVTQTLFSASMIAAVLPALWERNPDEARLRLEELQRLTRGALAEMRTLLLELRPAALVETPLDTLLHHLGEAAAGHGSLSITVTTERECRLPPDVHVAFYRIAQEALNNIVKHAHAGRARIDLRGAPGRVELTIEDDGSGFDPDAVAPQQLGIAIMRERAQAVGARLHLDSRPNQGARVLLSWADSA